MYEVPYVSVERVEKTYGPVTVLKSMDFAVNRGEVHALVGENGAGKSTLIKILSGTVNPSDGSVLLYGKHEILQSPLHAQELGIQTVFQELTLIPDLTVADNILNVRSKSSLYKRTGTRQIVEDARSVLSHWGIRNDEIDPASYVRDLSLPQRQLIEIVKSLYAEPRILILDEATSALLGPQVEWLFKTVRRLRDLGTAIIFTSHRWDEVKRFSDRLTILRNGENVGTYESASVTEDQVTFLMTGRRIDVLFPEKKSYGDDIALRATNLKSDVLRDVNLEVHKGEIVGVGGVQGQGQQELFMSLFGALQVSGKIEVHGHPVILRSPRDAVRQGIGIGMVPEDRKTEGLFLNLNILENVTMPTLDRISRMGFLQEDKRRDLFRYASERLQIKMSGIHQNVQELSGGNQQKVVLAKWLAAHSSVLLLYDVTRGVDIGTKSDIYQLMSDLASSGVAILFYSSETAEVVHMSHKVLVMFDGSVREELEGEDLTEDRVVGASVRVPLEVRHA